MRQNFGNFSAMDSRAIALLRSKIATTKIFVISKTNCNACVQAKALLNMLVSGTKVTPSFFDLDSYPSHYSKVIMNYISSRTGVKTVPQIWINGKFIGGNDDIQSLHREGRLMSLIRFGSIRGRTSSSLSRNFVSPMLRIAPLKAEVLFKPSIDSKPLITNTYFQRIGNMSKRPSYFRSSVHRNEADRNIQRGLSMSFPSSRAQKYSLNYSGNAILNTNTSRRISNFSLKGRPLIDTGKISKLNWPSDEAILNIPSVTLQPRGPIHQKEGPDFAIISGWI